ncbi:MAG: prepilin peptidase [Arcobacteraceae bacterium]
MISSPISIKGKDDLVGFEAIFIIIFALTIGSFLNVLIYRLPLGISLFNPKRSVCPHCDKIILWYENIPVISYLIIRGRCTACHTPISLKYPFIEIITALVSYVLFIKLGLTAEFYFMCVICYILIVLSFIDLQYKAVPYTLLVILTFITLIYLSIYKLENISYFFIFAGAIVIIDLFVTYYIQNIKSYLLKDDSLKEQKALGEGDIPIIALIGGVLGLQFGVVAIFLSAILAIIPSIINIVCKKEIETPFIPYLSLAFLITFLNQTNIVKIFEGI